MIVRQDGSQAVIIIDGRAIARLDLDQLGALIWDLSQARIDIRWTMARWAEVRINRDIFDKAKCHLATVDGSVPSERTLCGRTILDDWSVWPLQRDPSPDVDRCSVCARQYQREIVEVAK